MRRAPPFASIAPWAALAALALVCGLFAGALPWLKIYPEAWTIPLASWISAVAEAGAEAIAPASRLLSWSLETPMLALRDLLQWIPWPALILIAAAIAWASGAGTGVVALTVIALLYVAFSGYWRQTMNTLALVGVATPLAVLVGMGLGVAMHYSRRARAVILPLLDLMQTMPTFAYLIPLLVLFGFGPVVGLIASAIFAAPPMVRNVALGLQRVPSEIVEAGRISGASPFQQLFWVEIPAAAAQIKIGLNQTIMAALSMVIIASVIGGFDDIGWEVLSTMRKARFGDSLLAGGVIVLIAVVMDRISAGFATKRDAPRDRLPLIIIVAAVATGLVARLIGLETPSNVGWVRDLAAGMDARLTAFVGESGETLAAIKNATFYYYLLPLRIGFAQAILPFTWGFVFTPEMKIAYAAAAAALAAWVYWRGSWRGAVAVAAVAYLLFFGLSGAPWPVLTLGAVLLAHAAAGWGVALFVACVCGLMLVTGLWEKGMLSLYLCGAAAILAFLLGAGLGVAAAASDRFSRGLRPVLDTFQTIPLFVFLIPTLMLFQIGEFTALLAIIAYSYVPAARYTENGLRQVDPHLLEVAEMQGCTPRQVFWQVKAPLAMPVILLGLNQTVLYSFAMLVIAALVGTTGLGQSVYVALGRADIGGGLIAGASMAFLAMAADRILRGWVGAKEA